MTELEIVIETIKHYQTNPRGTWDATDGQRCVYYSQNDGAMCAVGRCLNWNKCRSLKTAEPAEVASITANGLAYRAVEGLSPATPDVDHAYAVSDRVGAMDPFLKKRYRGHSARFWTGLQQLHDNSLSWQANNEGGQSLTFNSARLFSNLLDWMPNTADELMSGIEEFFADDSGVSAVKEALKRAGH